MEREASTYVRIKKGVRPYGGRVVKVAGREGMIVRVHAPTNHRSGWMHSDIREYYEHEVEACGKRS